MFGPARFGNLQIIELVLLLEIPEGSGDQLTVLRQRLGCDFDDLLESVIERRTAQAAAPDQCRSNRQGGEGG